MAAKTENAVSENTQKPKPKVNTNVIDLWWALMYWIRVNLVPIIALPVLGILSADDIKKHLVSSTQFGIEFGLVVGIAVAALLVVSVGSNKH